MIDRIYFKNFKAFAELDLPLKPLTVLVGPNGSGKTSILEGLWWLAGYPLHRAPTAARRLGTSAEAAPMTLAWFSGQVGQRILLNRNDDLVREVVSPGVQPPGDPASYGVPSNHPAPKFQRQPKAQLLRLSAAQLAKPSYSDQSPPLLETDGTNLPSVLAYLALNQPDEFEQLQASCRRVLPAVKRMRFDRAMVTRTEKETVAFDDNRITRLVDRQFPADTLIFDMASGISLPADFASEGMLLVLGLLAALFGRPKPDLVLLDDLDHGLHPRAQRELVKLLQDLLTERPTLRIVATTHSPDLVDCIPPESVVCNSIDLAGVASASPLTEHPDFDRWKDEMSSGELWSVFGEKWVTEKPTKEPADA